MHSPYDIKPRRKADGSVCCEFFDETGPRLSLCCDDCQQHYLREERQMLDATPPNPYAKPLAAMRTAASTPLSRFEEEWKAARRRDLKAGRA